MGDNDAKGAIIGKIMLDPTHNFGNVTNNWAGDMLVRALLQPAAQDVPQPETTKKHKVYRATAS